MSRRVVALVVAVLALGVAASAALAQSKPRTSSTSTPPTAGAFDKLSPGNQTVASALFQAQNTETTPPVTPLTLDQIATKKQSGQGWGQVFKDMKAQGLVQEKNLGQVVGNHSTHGVVTTASGRIVSGPSSSGKAAGIADGNADASQGATAGGNGNRRSNAFGAGSNGSEGAAAHGGGKGGK